MHFISFNRKLIRVNFYDKLPRNFSLNIREVENTSRSLDEGLNAIYKRSQDWNLVVTMHTGPQLNNEKRF